MSLNIRPKLIFTLLLIFTMSNALAAEPDDVTNQSFAEAFTGATPYFDIRYRYEFVEQEDLMKDAKASTIRSRFGIKTGIYRGFQALVEAEDISVVGAETYNNTINGKTEYPVVADPESTEINQAWLSYSKIPKTNLKYGRHKLVLDNARFIGDVGWRQNNQTHDGALIVTEPAEGLALTYGYTHNVNRIFGDDHPSGDFHSKIHIGNLKFTEIPYFDLTAYSYFLDLENATELSSRSFGGLLEGEVSVKEEFGIVYASEVAYQEDHADNSTDYDALYYRIEPGISFGNFLVKAGWEVLGSDNGTKAFSTPLATLHKWNGWADKFLVTPDSGLVDVYGLVSYKLTAPHEYLDQIKLTAVYHDFSSDEGSMDYGTEWDLDLTAKIYKHYLFGIKYANYDAESFSVDTEKLIFTLGGVFSL